MSLRRLAQTNAAAHTTPASPRVGESSAQTSPTTPIKNQQRTQTTPRARLVYPTSPLTSPSLSASVPFDWAAARERRPPPYSSPLAAKRVRGRTDGPSPQKGAHKRVVRKKGLVEKISSIPSEIAFQLSLFPNNVPLPTPRNSAWIIGGTLHFLHLCVRFSQSRSIPESDGGWEDMYRETESESSWFDWTIPVTFFLVSASFLNVFRLFTQTRIYQLSLATDPVSSPHAKFVSRTHSPSPFDVPEPEPSLLSLRSLWRILISTLSYLWKALVVSIRFLFNLTPPKSSTRSINTVAGERVQQLEVWTPGELEMKLFTIYSPLHAFMWMATSTSNWMWMSFVMFVASSQLKAMVQSYEVLIKDKAIISAEVLHEYDEKFVYPRINPIRKDAAVMTHQAEMINIWEDHRSPRAHHGIGVGR